MKTQCVRYNLTAYYNLGNPNKRVEGLHATFNRSKDHRISRHNALISNLEYYRYRTP